MTKKKTNSTRDIYFACKTTKLLRYEFSLREIYRGVVFFRDLFFKPFSFFSFKVFDISGFYFLKLLKKYVASKTVIFPIEISNTTI